MTAGEQALFVEVDNANERKYSYLHFNVPEEQGEIVVAKLIMQVGQYPLQNMEVWGGVDSLWSTCWPTWNNQPQVATELIGSTGEVPRFTFVEIPVDSLVTEPGSYTFKLLDSQPNQDDYRYICSSENTQYEGPKLHVIFDTTFIFADGFESGDTSAWSATVQ